jgi:hypothetical protein
LGDRIVHAFFRNSISGENDGSIQEPVLDKGIDREVSDKDGNNDSSSINEEKGKEFVNFHDFVCVLARFRPLKKTQVKNKLNGRDEKLRCKS